MAEMLLDGFPVSNKLTSLQVNFHNVDKSESVL